MKRILIILIFIFSCMPESVDVPDPINVIDSTDPVIPVEYGLQEYEIEFDGLLRSFNIYVPDSYDPSEPVPMLFCFHGYGSNNQVIMEYTEFNDIASEENFIVVYPQGTFLNGITHWNVGGWTTSSIVDRCCICRFFD